MWTDNSTFYSLLSRKFSRFKVNNTRCCSHIATVNLEERETRLVKRFMGHCDVTSPENPNKCYVISLWGSSFNEIPFLNNLGALCVVLKPCYYCGCCL